MKNLQNKIEILEKSIKKLEKRNKKVEADKSWETSTFRKISVAVITYLIIVIIMYLLNFKDVFTNALIPTFGFLLSTLSIDILKKYYNTELNFEKINKKIMKNKTLILHGWGGNSEENWLPWLKKEIELKVEDLFIPNLPNTDNPVIEEQLDYINIYHSDFSEGGNIIGHSLGCQLAVNFLEENNIKNSKIILVAPSYPKLSEELVEILGDSFDVLKKYYNTELNFEKINKLNNEFIVFLSDNDPYINMQNAKKYYNKLENVKFIEFKGKGHFNQDAGVLELEEILEYLK